MTKKMNLKPIKKFYTWLGDSKYLTSLKLLDIERIQFEEKEKLKTQTRGK